MSGGLVQLPYMVVLIVLTHDNVIGYHQKCHETKILQRALEDDSSWICYFCEQEMACPYVTNADALTQSLEDIEEQGSKPDKLQPKKVGNECSLFVCDM